MFTAGKEVLSKTKLLLYLFLTQDDFDMIAFADKKQYLYVNSNPVQLVVSFSFLSLGYRVCHNTSCIFLFIFVSIYILMLVMLY